MTKYSTAALNQITQELEDEINEIISVYQEKHAARGFEPYAALVRSYLDCAQAEGFNTGLQACAKHYHLAVEQVISDLIDKGAQTLLKHRRACVHQAVMLVEKEREKGASND